MKNRITVHIEKVADKVYEFMSTDIGRQSILCPRGRTDILNFSDEPHRCASEVSDRFHMFINAYLQSEEVMKEFYDIKKDTEIFLKETSLHVYVMEHEWTAELIQKPDTDKLFYALQAGIIIFLVALSPALLDLLTVEGLKQLARFPFKAAYRWINSNNIKENNKIAIDEAYKNCKGSVRKTVCLALERNTGTVLTKLIDRVTAKILPRRIAGLEEMILNLLKSRQKISADQKLLLTLSRNIEAILQRVYQIQDDLKQRNTPA